MSHAIRPVSPDALSEIAAEVAESPNEAISRIKTRIRKDFGFGRVQSGNAATSIWHSYRELEDASVCAAIAVSLQGPWVSAEDNALRAVVFQHDFSYERTFASGGSVSITPDGRRVIGQGARVTRDSGVYAVYRDPKKKDAFEIHLYDKDGTLRSMNLEDQCLKAYDHVFVRERV